MNAKLVLPAACLIAGSALLYVLFRDDLDRRQSSSTALDELRESWVDGADNTDLVKRWLLVTVRNLATTRSWDVILGVGRLKSAQTSVIKCRHIRVGAENTGCGIDAYVIVYLNDDNVKPQITWSYSNITPDGAFPTETRIISHLTTYFECQQ